MLDQLLELLSETIGVDKSRLNEDSSAENIAEWDSLKHMNIVFAVEDKFGVTIPDDKLTECVSVKALIDILNKKE